MEADAFTPEVFGSTGRGGDPKLMCWGAQSAVTLINVQGFTVNESADCAIQCCDII